jgi:DNA end-binding protein Ku
LTPARIHLGVVAKGGKNGRRGGKNGAGRGHGGDEDDGEASGSRRRPVWSGALSFGLVNVPVKLFSATASHDVHFHEYQAKTGQRIHHKRVAESSGREVAYDDIVKGYEVSKGKVVLLEPEEIKALAPRRSRMIEIEQFVDLAEIDPIVWDATYYLGPGNETAAKSYELLRRAMEDTNKVGIGRFVMRNKEYLVTVRPLGKGLVIETMHYQDEIRDQKEAVTDLPARVSVNPRELGMARQLIESLSAKWDHSKFEDKFRDQVRTLIQKKAKGQKIEVVEEAPPEAQVVDLMEALKASLHGGKPRKRGGRQKHAA